jgi:hypothetical protein
MIIVFVVLSPSSPLPCRICGRPATFIDSAEKVPAGVAAGVAAQSARRTKARRPSEVEARMSCGIASVSDCRLRKETARLYSETLRGDMLLARAFAAVGREEPRETVSVRGRLGTARE